MDDELLLEAMREVDELTPAAPPIAPAFRGRVMSDAQVDQAFVALEQREYQQQCQAAIRAAKQRQIACLLLNDQDARPDPASDGWYSPKTGRRVSQAQVLWEELNW